MPRVLVVDDDAVSCQLLTDILSRDGLEVISDTAPARALAQVAGQPVDLAILDLRMPEVSGLRLMQQLRAQQPALPVIIMTAFGSMDTAAEAIGSGAIDYVSKPMNVEEIRGVVARALARPALSAADASDRQAADAMVGRTPAMIALYTAIARVAAAPSTVLILGESGTGKELVARAIHRHSPRRHRPFVAVDCTALTETLLESELFGHVRGAFTNAVQDAPGLFAEADGGTVFLDELGEIGAPLQAKLLRVLQEHTVRPVGGTQWRAVDVRVVAATNRDLAAAVAAGQFREDLYYRLKVVTLAVPPLRERREDIPLLVQHLVQRAAAHCGKAVHGVSPAALAMLEAHDWPGNVRELSHVLERAVALSHGAVLDLADLPPELRTPGAPSRGDLLADSPTLDALKQRYIRLVVQQQGGNVTRAAAVLGLERRSLYRMLQRYGIDHRGE
ncbi:MAG: sigma-54 dependent transcriptional regulator [Deltaproteobacteria bacterium]|nr:sigma-54 dependent transcriptional regulator [Deltaproteobacteria bacterium]